MIKKILLIRHAKTEQSNFKRDFDRILTQRGISDCEKMSVKLAPAGFIPDHILVSPAARTLETAELLCKHLSWNPNLIHTPLDLYLAPAYTLMKAIKETDERVNCLALIGHNPGITELFQRLGKVSLDHLPTCGMGLFELKQTSWKQLMLDDATMQWVSWPKKMD